MGLNLSDLGPSTLFVGKRIYEKESIHWLTSFSHNSL